jgi:hypothetical protein
MLRFSGYLVVFALSASAIFLAANLIAFHLDWLWLNEHEAVIIAKRNATRGRVFTVRSDKPHVVVFGDSRLTSGFIPAVFDASLAHRTSTLNLAAPSHDASRQYFQLLDYIDAYGVPDFVLIDLRTSPGLLAEYPLGASFAEMIEYSKEDLSNTKAILRYAVPALHLKRQYPPTIDQLLEPMASYRTQTEKISEMILQNGVYWPDERKNYSLPPGFATKADRPTQPPDGRIDAKLRPWVDRLFGALEHRAVKTLLVTTPFRANSVAQYLSPPAYISDITERFRNVRIAKNGWAVKWYPSESFYDSGHLNYAGATRYSREIALEFTETYGF